MAAERGVQMQAVSAGYYDWGPLRREVHPFARRAVRQLAGGDLLQEHRAARWTNGMVRSADLVVVAEQWMASDFPHGKVVTLRELAGEHGDVPDPYGGNYDVFLECAQMIRRLLDAGWGIISSAGTEGS